MCALIAPIAVHSIRVDHEDEFLAGFVQGIKKLKGILMVDIVVAGAVGELEHDVSIVIAVIHRIAFSFLMPFTAKARSSIS